MTGNPKGSKWYSVPRVERRNRGVELTLSPAARAQLDELAKIHGSRSAAVEALVLATIEEREE